MTLRGITLSSDWGFIPSPKIIEGTTENGTRYLKLFLQDYTKLFPSSKPNAGCSKCLKDYINQVKTEIMSSEKKETKSNYSLHAKREGLFVEYGDPEGLTNKNITDEKAEALFKRLKSLNEDLNLSDVFKVYPENSKSPEKPKQTRSRKPKVEDIEVIEGNLEASETETETETETVVDLDEDTEQTEDTEENLEGTDGTDDFNF